VSTNLLLMLGLCQCSVMMDCIQSFRSSMNTSDMSVHFLCPINTNPFLATRSYWEGVAILRLVIIQVARGCLETVLHRPDGRASHNAAGRVSDTLTMRLMCVLCVCVRVRVCACVIQWPWSCIHCRRLWGMTVQCPTPSTACNSWCMIASSLSLDAGC